MKLDEETSEVQMLKQAAQLPAEPRSMTLIVFSGDMDKLLAALSIASNAAAMGVEVSMFFNFWGLSALRRTKSFRNKPILQRILNILLPSRASHLPMSRKSMLGAGPLFFRRVMKTKNVANVPELVETVRSLGVRLIACAMSMDVMGISQDELIDGVELGGAASCVKDLMHSEATLFI